jgi:hypothetical protein
MSLKIGTRSSLLQLYNLYNSSFRCTSSTKKRTNHRSARPFRQNRALQATKNDGLNKNSTISIDFCLENL